MLQLKKRRQRGLYKAALGTMPPPLSASDEAAIDRNMVLNLVE